MDVRLQKEYRSAWHAKASVESAVNRIMKDLIEIKYAADWLYQKAQRKEVLQDAQQAQQEEQPEQGQGPEGQRE